MTRTGLTIAMMAGCCGGAWALAPRAARAQDAPDASAPESPAAESAPPSPSQQQPVTFAWHAPPECPDQDAVRASIERLLGRPARVPADRPLGADAVVSRRGARWQVRINVTSGTARGRRALEGARCEQVASATALVVALAIDPTAALAHATPADSGEPPPPPHEPFEPAPTPPMPLAAEPPPPPRTAPPAPRRAPRPAPRRATRPRVLVRLEGLLGGGTLPGPALGAGVAAGLITGIARVEAGFTYWAGQHAVAAEQSNVGVDLWSYAFTARGCLGWSVQTFSFGPCVAAQLGAVVGHGTGVTARDAATPWFALLAGGAVDWRPLPFVGLRLGADLGAAPTLAVFEATDHLPTGDHAVEVYRSSALVVRGYLGVEANF